jgi:hypothetical protein
VSLLYTRVLLREVYRRVSEPEPRSARTSRKVVCVLCRGICMRLPTREWRERCRWGREASALWHLECGLSSVWRAALLDPALVLTTHDLEEAGVAPIGVPRIGDRPVIALVGVGSPADDLDCTQHTRNE